MRFALIFSLLLAIVAVVFAFENPDPVNVEFLTFRSQEVPLALVIILSLLTGVIVGTLFSVPNRFRSRSRIKKLEKRIAEVETTPRETVVVEEHDAPVRSATGAAETERMAAETQRMAADAERRATDAERRAADAQRRADD